MFVLFTTFRSLHLSCGGLEISFIVVVVGLS